MKDENRIIFNKPIEGRSVKIKIDKDGVFHFETTQKEDDEGAVIYSDESTIGTMLPTEKGRDIIDDAQNLEKLQRELIANDFSKAAAYKIVIECQSFLDNQL
jgi:formamidopyrimidine-DNA glycosylase